MFVQRFDRLFSLGILSALIAWWLTIDIGSKHAMGKEAYVAYSSGYFDRYYARPFHPTMSAIGYFFFIAAFFAIYEGIAFFIRRIGASRPSSES
jgi:hypothetical protein